MKYWHGSKTRKLVIVICLILIIPAFAVADDEGDLAKLAELEKKFGKKPNVIRSKAQ